MLSLFSKYGLLFTMLGNLELDLNFISINNIGSLAENNGSTT